MRRNGAKALKAAKIDAAKKALFVLVSFSVLEAWVIIGERKTINTFILTMSIAIPIICALLTYFIFKSVVYAEELYERDINYIRRHIEEGKYMSVVIDNDTGVHEFLHNKARMYAILTRDNMVIVAIKYRNGEIIPFEEIPRKLFEKKYIIIE